MRSGSEPESSAKIRERVMRAREMQWRRFLRQAGEALLQRTDGAPAHPHFLRSFWGLWAPAGTRHDRQGLTARAHDRILKVARTIADLDSATGIESTSPRSIQYRTLDRTFWAWPWPELVSSSDLDSFDW